MSVTKLRSRVKVVELVAGIVDELGEITEQRKVLEIKEKTLKARLHAYGPGSYNGKVFDAQVKPVVREGYKAELLRIHVDHETLEKCIIKTPYLTVSTERKAELT